MAGKRRDRFFSLFGNEATERKRERERIQGSAESIKNYEDKEATRRPVCTALGLARSSFLAGENSTSLFLPKENGNVNDKKSVRHLRV